MVSIIIYLVRLGDLIYFIEKQKTQYTNSNIIVHNNYYLHEVGTYLYFRHAFLAYFFRVQIKIRICINVFTVPTRDIIR